MLELRQIESFYPEHLRPFKRNLLREYLQYRILEAVFSSEFSRGLRFMGGTALHIVYELPRFSEDLDFDNAGLDKKDFSLLAELIKKRLNLHGYNTQIKSPFKGAYRIFIRIADVLYENKISSHKEEKMLIHLDAEPQGFAYAPDKIILNKFDIFTQISVVPLDILLSQKLRAILTRKRPMGRDFFDAIFLLGRTRPSYEYLKSKLKIDNLRDLKSALIAHCRALDLRVLAKDVRQFLFLSDEAKKIELFRDYVENLDAGS